MSEYKRTEWLIPDRMKFESTHKTFNKQIDLISTGNVWGKGQFSNYIRPFAETECNGFTNPPGKLRDFDLSYWDERQLPHSVRKYVKDVTQDQNAILYEFFHYGYHNRSRVRIVDGYVVTRGHKNGHKLLQYFITGPTNKSQSVILGALPYITPKAEERMVS